MRFLQPISHAFCLFYRVGWDHALSLTPYGDYFRHRRRLMHQVLSQRPVQMFWPAVEQQTAKLLKRLLDTPEHLVDHIRQFAPPFYFSHTGYLTFP